MKRLIFLTGCLVFLSCKNDSIPKPKGFLRLEYPNAAYSETDKSLPFTFEKNNLSKTTLKVTNSGKNQSVAINMSYPLLKGTIYLTYKRITNLDLNRYLIDAKNITQKHAQKADAIIEQPYMDNVKNVYGMLYQIDGNVASQSQFYVTDSLHHFVTGSVYFFAKPNYDSILPAANYLKKDIQHIMETITWNSD